MIKFSHTIFALPFALTAMIFAASGHNLTFAQMFWVVIAMVGARTAAMAFNRLSDHEIDARNPRTRMRELPAGVLDRGEVWPFVVGGAAALIIAAWRLNPLCLALSPIALAVILGYSFTKRFTMLSHVVLGLSLAIAPIGAWIAIRGTLDGPALLLGGGVLFWVAGFDIIYACQDVEFDRSAGLVSIPARFGVPMALKVSRAFHVVAWWHLVAVGAEVGLANAAYAVTMLLLAAFFIRQHWLVRGGDMARVDLAFFTMNGWVSVVYFLGSSLAYGFGAGLL